MHAYPGSIPHVPKSTKRRFDGKQWTSYTTADGLAGNIIYSMAQDARGVLWLGTNHSLSRYDGKSWASYR